uniref:Uncharacterized protein n=1 Tax=Brassica oleracea var. oleracea TaxID=109376 RepID=A0A0D3BQV8_BRAOL
IGVSHGVLGDIWVHLELKRGDKGDHWTSSAWERPFRSYAMNSLQLQSEVTTATPQGRLGCVDLRATNKPGATSHSDYLRSLPTTRATSRSDVPRCLMMSVRAKQVEICLEKLEYIRVSHGVLGDIWVYLELKRGDKGDHWTSSAWERPFRSDAMNSLQLQSEVTTATPRGRSGYVDLRATNMPGATSHSDYLRPLPTPRAISRSDVPRSLRFNYLVELMINQGPSGHLLCTFYTF